MPIDRESIVPALVLAALGFAMGWSFLHTM
jgi:hypothetical protein